MKNYITIAALLAAGTAFANAATNGVIDTTDKDLKAYFDFATSSNQTAGSINWNELPTWKVAGYGESKTTTTHPYTSSAGLSAKDGFTVSFDVNDLETGTLLSMTTSNMSAAWRSLSISYADGNVTAKFHGGDNVVGSASIDSSAWTTLTLVGSTVDSKLNLDFYVNGTEVGSAKGIGATNFIGETINNVQFGYYGTSSNSASTNIDNILVYKKALTATEVKALIPEPSAFGLLAGLGALALVGTRRRRR